MADATRHTLESLMLSLRARNCLTQAGINTVEDLLSYTARDLNHLPWLGRATLKDIVDCLSSAGFALRPGELHLPQLPQSAWTYILLSERGEIYLGATTNLRSRLKAHNSSGNSSWTKGRRWHILGVRLFESKSAAFSYELELKKYPHKKIIWKLQCIERASKIAKRHGYQFNPTDWLHNHHPSYVKAAVCQNSL